MHHLSLEDLYKKLNKLSSPFDRPAHDDPTPAKASPPQEWLDYLIAAVEKSPTAEPFFEWLARHYSAFIDTLPPRRYRMINEFPVSLILLYLKKYAGYIPTDRDFGRLHRKFLPLEIYPKNTLTEMIGLDGLKKCYPYTLKAESENSIEPLDFDTLESYYGLLEYFQEGDEIWRFSTYDKSPNNLCGRAGFSVVRNGEVYVSYVSIMS